MRRSSPTKKTRVQDLPLADPVFLDKKMRVTGYVSVSCMKRLVSVLTFALLSTSFRADPGMFPSEAEKAPSAKALGKRPAMTKIESYISEDEDDPEMPELQDVSDDEDDPEMPELQDVSDDEDEDEAAHTPSAYLDDEAEEGEEDEEEEGDEDDDDEEAVEVEVEETPYVHCPLFFCAGSHCLFKQRPQAHQGSTEDVSLNVCLLPGC